MVSDYLREILYNAISDVYLTDEKISNELPAPSYKGKKNTDFLDKLIAGDANLNNIIYLKGIVDYLDLKVVWGDVRHSINTDDWYSIVGVFDLNNKLLFKSTLINDPSGNSSNFNIPLIKELAIDRNGFIYGLCNFNNRINFFRFSDLLDALGFEKNNIPPEIFFTAFVDVSTVNIDGSTTYGSNAFKNYDLIDFKNDYLDSEIYAFVMWNNISKKITVVKFSVGIGDTKQNQLEWEINEDIKIEDSKIPETFTDLSQVGIATGDKVISNQKTVIGSLVLASTEKSINGIWELKKDVLNLKVTLPFSDTWLITPRPSQNIFETNFNIQSFKNDIKNKLDLMKSQVNLYKNVKVSIIIHLETDIGTADNIIIKLTEQEANYVLNSNNNIFKMIFDYDDLPQALRFRLKNENLEMDWIGTDFLGNKRNTRFNYIKKKFAKGRVIFEPIFEFEEFNATPQKSISYFISINKNDNNEIKYLVETGVSNITQASKPVFLNSTKCYMPMKNNENGNYNIYELITQEDNTATLIKNIKVMSTPDNSGDPNISGSTFTFKLPDMVRLIKVTQDGFTIFPSHGINSVRPKYDPPFNTTIDFVLVTPNTEIQIEYESNYRSKIVNELGIPAVSSSNEVLITEVINKDELNVNQSSIVGAAFSIANDIGFTLYSDKSNADLNTIAENVLPKTMDIKHVIATRQNDELFIYAYNQDFSEEIEWISIYPESFHPYTFLPYRKREQELNLERINASTDKNISGSIFDKEIQEIITNSNIIIVTTKAKKTDFNFTGQVYLNIYGHTNKHLLRKEIKNYTKSRIETKSINYEIRTTVSDQTQANDINRVEASETLAHVFQDNNIGLTQTLQVFGTIEYSDGTKQDITNNNLGFELVGKVLRVHTSIRIGSKDIVAVSLINKNGDLLTREENLCLNKPIMHLTWDLEIKDDENPDNIWDQAIWDESEWQ